MQPSALIIISEVQAMKLEDAFPEITHQKFDIYQEDDSKPDDIQPSFPPYHSPIGRRDFVKFMTRDKTGSESHILRFLATLCGINNENRQFVISYHLVDDTISIFEKPQRNSGSKRVKQKERNNELSRK